jgi:hypothetical protein
VAERRGEREVQLFGEAMLEKLAENGHKKHWREESVDEHLSGIEDELKELELDVIWLRIAKRKADGPRIEELRAKIRREAADIGNRAMFAADAVGGLVGGLVVEDYDADAPGRNRRAG